MKVSVIGQSGIAGSRHLQTAMEWGAEIVEPDNADVVVVAIPDSLHGRYCVRHLSLGQSVFCEKPIATKKEDLEQITVLSRKAALGCHLPLREKAGEFKIEGQLVEMLYDYGRRDKFIGSWRNDKAYNLVMGAGIHLMDLLMRKLGIDYRDCVTVHRQQINPAAKCADRFMGRFRLNGTRCALKVDFTKNGPHRHVVSWGTGKWVNTEEVDKQVQLRRFLDKPVTDELALASHRACLEFA